MIKSILTAIVFCFLFFPGLRAQKSYNIVPINVNPVVDGIADDSIWQSIPAAGDFLTTLPYFAQTPQYPTLVKMAFDERGIYILAECKSGKVRNDGAHRDNQGTGDYFSIGLDPWNDDQNAFVFTVTAGGQITDNRISGNINQVNFDTPWKARTRQNAGNWTAEICIPFAALRYPTKGDQNWGLQFTRFDRNTGETSTWNPQDPTIRDDVWQYGQLEGLVTPKKALRLGGTLYRTTQFNNRYSSTGIFPGTNSEYVGTGVALDGRIGFNSATALDIGILPAVSLIDNSLYDWGSNYWQKLFKRQAPEMAGPRFLAMEGYGINAKSSIHQENPGVFSGTLIRDFHLPADQLAFTRYEPRIIQQSRFATRTRSNIGISVANTVFNRPEFEIYQLDAFFTYINNEKIGFNPIHNQIMVEKAFRNNSWINVSTSNFFLGGKGQNVNGNAINGQWRDRSNQFQASGSLSTFTQSMETGAPYTRAIGNAAVAKVNGKYNWRLAYSSPDNRASSILFSPGIFPGSYPNLSHAVRASVSQQNFKPALPWLLNSRQTLFLNMQLGGDFTNGRRYATGWNVAGLTRHFRQFTGEIRVDPQFATETLDFTTIQFKGKKSVPFEIAFSHTTDTRKKSILTYGAGIDWQPYFWQLTPYLQGSPAWVLSKKWTVIFNNFVYLPAKANYIVFNTGNEYVFERSSNWGYNNKTEIRFYPTRKWAINLFATYRLDMLSQRSTFTFGSRGEKIPANMALSATSANERFDTGISVDWYFSSVKHFNFRYNYLGINNTHQFNTPFFRSTPFVANNLRRTVFEWSWVWNFNN